MNGGQFTGRILSEHGVRHIFTLCGGHISPILTGCKGEGIRVIDVRNEATAVFAADIYSRLSGITGVAAVTAGPGVTNTITALKNAQMAQSSIVLLGGATATILKGRGSLQDIDQLSLIKSSVKWHASAKCVREIPGILSKAFYMAQKGVPGPVFVELPVDLLYDEKTVREWYGMKSEKKKSFKEKITQWYISRHLNKLFSGVDKVKNPPIMKPPVARHIPSDVRKAAGLLKSAVKPVMLLGSQVVVNPEKIPAVIKAVESLGIPVFLSGMARGILGKNHPLQIRHYRKEALRKADWILLAGVPCDFRLDYGRHLSPVARFISVNRCKEDLFKNKKPHFPVHSDPALFLADLSREVNGMKSPAFNSFVSELKKSDEKREAVISEQERQNIQGINPLRVLRKLENSLDENSMLVADGGDFVAASSYIVQPRKPLSWLDPGVFGTLGGGAGFALASKLFNPSSEVWIIYGDGSLGYSLIEFDTFVRHKVPVIALVGNDACWSQIERDQVEILKDDIATKLAFTDYHIAAKGLGGEGLLLDDETKMDEVFAEAKRIAKAGKPVLINAVIGKTDFRKGSISM